jgi:hypothetical protein
MVYGRWQDAINGYQDYLKLKGDPDLAAFLEKFQALLSTAAPSLSNGLQFPPTANYQATATKAP